MKKSICSVLLAAVVMLATACGGANGGAGSSTQPAAEVNYTQLQAYTSSLEDMVLPDKKIVALGEATHGNKEFTLLKQTVFQNLVQNNGVRVFALEGDFGGCQIVNNYIQGGEGTAKEAAAAIGFAIYRTEEMETLIEWMRTYNAEQEESEQLSFYGYDMQRYDANKQSLFAYLSAAAPEVSAEYEQKLQALTDEGMYDLNDKQLKEALKDIQALRALMEENRADWAAEDDAQYLLAAQNAQCIEENTLLRLSTNNYGTLRDDFMAQKVSWIAEYTQSIGGSGKVFVAGHNGHVEKTSKTMGTDKCMGQLLAEEYGEEYYVIVTEFYKSAFLASDAKSGERSEFTVVNEGSGRFADILHTSGRAELFLNTDAAAENADLTAYLQAAQPISMIGDAFASGYEKALAAYTLNLVPQQAFNALIFIEEATPSTMAG